MADLQEEDDWRDGMYPTGGLPNSGSHTNLYTSRVAKSQPTGVYTQDQVRGFKMRIKNFDSKYRAVFDLFSHVDRHLIEMGTGSTPHDWTPNAAYWAIYDDLAYWGIHDYLAAGKKPVGLRDDIITSLTYLGAGENWHDERWHVRQGNYSIAFINEGSDTVYKVTESTTEYAEGGGDDVLRVGIPRATPADVRGFFTNDSGIRSFALPPYESIQLGDRSYPCRIHVSSYPRVRAYDTPAEEGGAEIPFDYVESLRLRYIANNYFGLTWDVDLMAKTYGYFEDSNGKPQMMLLDGDFMRPLMPDGSNHKLGYEEYRLTPEDLLRSTFATRFLEEYYPGHSYDPGGSGNGATSQSKLAEHVYNILHPEHYKGTAYGDTLDVDIRLEKLVSFHKKNRNPIHIDFSLVKDIFDQVQLERDIIVPDEEEVSRRCAEVDKNFPNYMKALKLQYRGQGSYTSR